jgi:hypothetical protein
VTVETVFEANPGKNIPFPILEGPRSSKQREFRANPIFLKKRKASHATNGGF